MEEEIDDLIPGEYIHMDDHIAAIAEKDKEIERLKALVADLTIGCMDNVEVKEDRDGNNS